MENGLGCQVVLHEKVALRGGKRKDPKPAEDEQGVVAPLYGPSNSAGCAGTAQ